MEVVLWSTLLSVFLYFYVVEQRIDLRIISHVKMFGVLWLGVLLFRYICVRLVSHVHIRRLLVAFIGSVFFFTLSTYYAMVIVGLKAWGRVISWDLIRSYFFQLPNLIEVLGLSPALVALIALIVFALLVWITWLFVRRFGWLDQVLDKFPRSIEISLLAAAFLLVFVQLYRFTSLADTKGFEPFALTFFPLEGAVSFQGNAVDKLASDMREAAEKKARKEYQLSSHPNKKNLVLIVVDALRTDHMSVFGYQRETTPRISEMVAHQGGHLISQMRSVCSESACGLYSISASKYVHQFSSHAITLQEVLKWHDYRVHMILGGDHINFYGLRDIYGKVDSYYDGSMERTLYANDDQLVIKRLDQIAPSDGHQTMFQFHLMSTHVLGSRNKLQGEFEPQANYRFPRLREKDLNGQASPTAVNYYDNGVRQTDEVIYQLIDTLKRKRYLDNTVVVITADHGEMLGEHNLFHHAKTLHEEVLRIPFIVLDFGGSTKEWPTEQRLSSQVDIAPTILGLLNINQPTSWSGQALFEGKVHPWIFVQQGEDKGLFDQTTERSYKYWKDGTSGSEYACVFPEKIRQECQKLAQPPLSSLANWRLYSMNPALKLQ